MKRFFKRLLGIDDEAAKDLVKESLLSIVCDMILLALMSLLFIFLQDTLIPVIKGEAPDFRYNLYIYIAVGFVVLSFLFYSLQYDALYMKSYSVSAKKRISLAEHLRRLPLSFFAKKDLTDVTTRMMNDVSMMEMTLSHFIPQLISSVVTTSIIALSMVIYD